jgi:hypothetical protein
VIDGPLTPDGLRVMAERCETCIFRPGNPMQLNRGRVREMVSESIKCDSFIPCHHALYESDEAPAVCRGFYDAYGDQTLGCRLGLLYGVIEVRP